MKTVIWGYWVNNLGDDLFLESFINEYKDKSNTNFYILTYKKYRQHYKAMGYIPICKDAIWYRACGKITRTLFRCEPYFFFCNKKTFFVMLGGSLFAENKSEKEEQLQYNNLKYAIDHSLESCVVGSNFGPFRTKTFLNKYRELFKFVGDICFRDLYSVNMFSGLNNIRFAPDLILAGFWDCPISNEDNDANNGIAIAPIDLSDRKNLVSFKEKYEEVLLSIINFHTSADCNVYLLPFCEQEGDLKVCEQLYNKADKKDRVILCQYDRNTIINTIKGCNKIYSTRFHAMILSIYFKKHCIPLVYDEKVKNAIECYTKGPEYFEIKDLEEEEISNIVNSKGISGINKNLKEEAKKQFLFLQEKYNDVCGRD